MSYLTDNNPFPLQKCRHGYNDKQCERCSDETTLLESLKDNPDDTQAFGRVALTCGKSMYDLDMSDYTALELTNLIDIIKAVRKAKVQKMLGFTK